MQHDQMDSVTSADSFPTLYAGQHSRHHAADEPMRARGLASCARLAGGQTIPAPHRAKGGKG